MLRFAQLFDEIDRTTSTNAKVAAMRAYFASAPHADAAWATFFLTGRRLKRLVPSAAIRDWTLAATGLPLPAPALTAVRSLVSNDAVAGAVTHLLTRPAPPRPTYVLGDASPVAMSEIVRAFRHGYGRPARLLPMPQVFPIDEDVALFADRDHFR